MPALPGIVNLPHDASSTVGFYGPQAPINNYGGSPGSQGIVGYDKVKPGGGKSRPPRHRDGKKGGHKSCKLTGERHNEGGTHGHGEQ